MSAHPPDIVSYFPYAVEKFRVHQFKSEDGFHTFKECAKLCSKNQSDIHVFWRGQDGRLEGDGYRVESTIREKARALLKMPPNNEDMWALFQLKLNGAVFEVGEKTSFESTGPWGAPNHYYDIFGNLMHWQIPLDDPKCIGLKYYGRPPIVVYGNRGFPDKVDYVAVFQFRFKTGN